MPCSASASCATVQPANASIGAQVSQCQIGLAGLLYPCSVSWHIYWQILMAVSVRGYLIAITSAGLGAEDHCRAYPSDAYRRKRDSYRRKQAAPTPLPGPSRSTLPGFLDPQQRASLASTPATQPSARSKPGGTGQPKRGWFVKTTEKPSIPPAAKAKVIKKWLQLQDPSKDTELVAVGVVRLPVKAGPSFYISHTNGPVSLACI